MKVKLVRESLYEDQAIDQRNDNIVDDWFAQWAPDTEYEIDDNFNIYVKGNLYLSGAKITSLPDNLEVSGYIDLENNKEITSLPDNLKVGKFLDLRNTNIISLPNNLKVKGSLFLEGTKITSLPDDLKVGGSILIHDTEITSPPDNLKVGGEIYIFPRGNI